MMKYLLLFVAVAVLFSLLMLSSRSAESDAFAQAKLNIVLRKMGHEILLQAGDSTSRVLPIRQLAEGSYQLEFESEFAFVPDSLVKTIERITKEEGLPESYLAEVKECQRWETVFGYAVLGSEQKEILPCKGRIQPKQCYVICLQFQPADAANLSWYFGLGSLALLGLGLLWYKQTAFTEKKERPSATPDQSQPNLGLFQFKYTTRELILGDQVIVLSSKEAQLLLIFTRNPQQLISRSRLLKEVWEDEGVLISRSLDVYISRLRKKLAGDPGVKLLNVPGQGYRLEVDRN